MKKKGKKVTKKRVRPSGGSRIAKRIFQSIEDVNKRVRRLEKGTKKRGAFDFLLGDEEE